MKVAVILNASAGSMTGEAGETMQAAVAEAFKQAGVAASIEAVNRDMLQQSVKNAAGRGDVDAVVVGGGDGTLNTGAAALVGGAKPLGVLPLGTLNHFAKDLGIPAAIDEAVAVIAKGESIEIDVGEVNDRIFLNNSSIGLYPSAVAERDELRHRHGGGKASAMLNACVDVLRRFPLLDVTLKTDDRTVSSKVPFVFVGNNRYEMSLFALGKRMSLQNGELGVYLTQNTNRFGVLRLAFRALLGRMKQDRDFYYVTLKHVEIRTGRRSVRVSLDGEVTQMSSPIRYEIRPRALRVLAPPRDAGGTTT